MNSLIKSLHVPCIWVSQWQIDYSQIYFKRCFIFLHILIFFLWEKTYFLKIPECLEIILFFFVIPACYSTRALCYSCIWIESHHHNHRQIAWCKKIDMKRMANETRLLFHVWSEEETHARGYLGGWKETSITQCDFSPRVLGVGWEGHPFPTCPFVLSSTPTPTSVILRIFVCSQNGDHA